MNVQSQSQLLLYLLNVLLLFQCTCPTSVSGDWKVAQRYDEVDLETTPLEFRTNSTLGSKDVSLVRFFTTENSFAGGIIIYFDSDLYYTVENCVPRTKLSANISSNTDKIWRVTLLRTSGITLQIHCDQVEVVKVTMSDTVCTLNGWSTIWARKMARFFFVPPTDTATNYYRPYQQGDPAANWTSVDLQIDLENTPLEIRTNVTTEDAKVVATFYNTQRKQAGGITILLTSPPQYKIGSCTSYDDFPTDTPTASEKIWRITKTNGTDIRLQIHCSGLEMMSMILSEFTCYDSGGWSEVWERDVEIFRFSYQDTASDFYRPYSTPGPCTGLKTEWTRNETSMIVTSAQFPVDSGTVISVTCYNSDYYNKGSKDIVCITDTEFGYIDEPECVERVLEPCTGLKTDWTDQLTTTTEFPVASGSKVEVRCSQPSHLNTGSSEVTCVTGTRFTFTREPSCYKLESCKAASKGIVLSPKGRLNVTFEIPEESTLVNITKDGVRVDALFQKSNNNTTYTLIKSFVSEDDGGVYVMNHKTLSQNLSCVSAVLIAVKTTASRSYLTDTIEGRLTSGGSDFSKIIEILPNILQVTLSYKVFVGSSELDPDLSKKSYELSVNGNFKVEGTSPHRYPNKYRLIHDTGDSASDIDVFDVTYELTISDDCKEQKVLCNGEPECADFSDEERCSARGVYSRMALSEKQELIVPTDPSRSHTVCFYTFGNLAVESVLISDRKSLNIPTKGFYCITYKNQGFEYQTYQYNTAEKVFKKHEEAVSPRDGVLGWRFNATSNVKNIIVYNKMLKEPEMGNYITQCGKEGYPSPDDLEMDHHFLVMYYQQLLANAQNDEAIKYVVLPSMCEEKATPSGSVDLVTTYLCDSGKTIIDHCEEENNNICTDDKNKECEYAESEIVALLKTPPTGVSCTKAEVKNEYNNNLAVKAITSANIFVDSCTSKTCIESAYLQDLKAGKTNVWVTNEEMGYTNWIETITAPAQNTPVRLNKDGTWDLKESSEGSLVCNVGSGSLINKALVFNSDSDYSQLKIEKAVLNKLTMCWAASGSGVLLHYTGLSSISGKDIYIAAEKTGERTYLTVYIAGFPEYFDLSNVLMGKYICLRWEKVTGRIDLAIHGEFIVGKNTYANSRKINLPSSGKLVVGAAMNAPTKPYKVDTTAGRWTGQINNLVIFDQFYNPLMMKQTSLRGICQERKKSKAWLSFEDVIAGSTNHNMYTTFNGEEWCTGNQGSRQKRQSEGAPANSITISINYDKYTSSPSDVSSWAEALPSGSGITVKVNKTYSVREMNSKGNVKIDPLNKLCFSGTSLDKTKGYNVEVSAYSTGMTSFQIGNNLITIEAGSPASQTAQSVFLTNGEICVTNVLSPSDYAPLDGYIESITFWPNPASTVSCPSETENLGDRGLLEWPATAATAEQNTVVTATCQYGKKDDYNKIGLATRTCGESGWTAGPSNSDNCAGKYTITVEEAEKYFDNTEISDDNVDEYANTINQVVQEDEEVTKEAVDTAAKALEKMSTSADLKITDTTMTTVVEVANTINLNSAKKEEENQKEEAESSKKIQYNRIVESVAKLVAKVEIEEDTTFVSKTESVSVAAYKPPSSPSSGGGEVEVSGDITATFEAEADGTNIDVTTGEDAAVKEQTSVIKIKRDQVDEGKNVWFTSYKGNSTLFKSDTTFTLDGQIIGAGIGEGKKNFDAGKGVLMTFYTDSNLENANALCQYWDMTGGVGVWSSEGMTFISKTENSIDCQSDHLTNFAILINPSNKYFTGAEELTLQIITIVGCTLSIIGLLATIIGLAVFKQIRSVLTNRVHIGLSTSLLFAYIFLLIGPDLVADEGVCYFFSILTHFCFLSAFCWMLCEAVNLYLRLVVVFESYSKMFLKFSIFSFVTPLVIVLITTIVEFAGNNGAYIVENEASGVRVVCWLDYKARMAAFLLPLLLILCANFIVFIMVMRVLFGNKKSATANNNKVNWLARLRSAVAVSTLIGLSWILGFFALGEASFGINIIFALCNSLQGVLICYLYCFAKTDVMTKWRSTIQSSFGRSTRDTSGLSTSHSGAPRPHARFNAAKSNTQSTSVTLSSKGPSTAVSNGNKNGKFNNVYSNISPRKSRYP